MATQTAIRERDVRLPDGLNLHYASQGPETGPGILMLHGYSDSWFSFGRVLPLLPDHLRVIVPDQRGHGQSARPRSGYGMDDLAADAVQLMDALQVPDAVVVGHSMGSFVARRVAEMAPTRVSRLMLMGSGPRGANAVLTDLRSAVHELTDPIDPDFVRAFQESTVHQPVPADFIAGAITNSQGMPARVWKALIDGQVAFAPTGAPRCPTLVIGGDRDAVFSREEHEALAAAIPGARLEIVEGVGHALHWERPERFAAALAGLVGASEK
jgi:non-heme chloroperoxidase